MTKQLLRLCLIGLMLLSGVAAASPSYDEGIDYLRIEPPIPTFQSKGKVQVVEFFWYGCPHCFHFEPYLENWLKSKPKNVEFVRVPAVLNPNWEILGRAYYASKLLGVEKQSHEALFNAIHVQGRNLNSEPALARFFTQFGVSEKKFREAYTSMWVDTRIRQARTLGKEANVRGVPSVMVDGKFLLNGELAGGNENMLKIVDYLIKKESTAAHATAGK
ncbi:MAG: thiol:disulfide interchange protein DsbA/DsbL [Gammaproteobacteria bacterium]|jgi:protein dithiol oxidoreductase (disulfide-forming)